MILLLLHLTSRVIQCGHNGHGHRLVVRCTAAFNASRAVMVDALKQRPASATPVV